MRRVLGCLVAAAMLAGCGTLSGAARTWCGIHMDEVVRAYQAIHGPGFSDPQFAPEAAAYIRQNGGVADLLTDKQKAAIDRVCSTAFEQAQGL